MHVLELSVSNCAAIHSCDTVGMKLNLPYFDSTIDNKIHYYSCNSMEQRFLLAVDITSILCILHIL